MNQTFRESRDISPEKVSTLRKPQRWNNDFQSALASGETVILIASRNSANKVSESLSWITISCVNKSHLVLIHENIHVLPFLSLLEEALSAWLH